MLYYTCHLRLLDILSLNVNSVEKCGIAAWFQTNNRSNQCVCVCIRIFAWIICSFTLITLMLCMSAFTYLHELAFAWYKGICVSENLSQQSHTYIKSTHTHTQVYMHSFQWSMHSIWYFRSPNFWVIYIKNAKSTAFKHSS